MSVRAYRQTNKADIAEDATFNLWHDREVFEHLEGLPSTSIMCNSNDEISHIEVLVEEVEELLKGHPFDPEIAKALRKDIAAAKKNYQGYIFYHCF